MDSVVHFEIPVDDVARAQRFYSTVFGWKINAIPEMGYTILHTAPTDEKGMIKEPGAINGGMMKRESPVKSPVITINVRSIEEAVSSVKAHGGKVAMEKVKVGEMGYAAYFEDTEGKIMGLWEEVG